LEEIEIVRFSDITAFVFSIVEETIDLYTKHVEKHLENFISPQGEKRRRNNNPLESTQQRLQRQEHREERGRNEQPRQEYRGPRSASVYYRQEQSRPGSSRYYERR